MFIYNYKYIGIKFISCLIILFLTFIGVSSIDSINNQELNKNAIKAEIPAYIIPEQLDIMTWYDPSIDDEYLKKRRYQLIMEYYKKSIRKLAKEASTDPFDSHVGMLMFIEHLKFMHDYYANDYNVLAMEVEDHPSRQEGIEMALTEHNLAYNEDVENVDDLVYNYFESYITTDYGLDMRLPDYNRPLNGLTKKEAFEKLNEEIRLHKRMFYKILEQEFDTWWD